MQEFEGKYEHCTLMKIRKQDIQLLTSHSEEINRKFTPSSKLIAHVLMIMKDKDDLITDKLICLLRRDIQYALAWVLRSRDRTKTYF